MLIGPSRQKKMKAAHAAFTIRANQPLWRQCFNERTFSSAPAVASGVARVADDWPNKPVRYINVFPAGGPTDTLSRIVCHELSELTSQQFIVDNKSGSGG